MEENTETVIWQRAQAGEDSAFGELFDRHSKTIYNHCFRRTGSWSTAEDLTSVVFFEAWRKRTQFHPERPTILPWLMGIANNVCRNALRSRRRYEAMLAKLPPAPDEDDPSDDVVDRQLEEQQMQRLLAAISGLPVRDQELIALCIWGEMSYADVADVMDIAIGTVKSRVSRLKEKLGRMEPQENRRHDMDEQHLVVPTAKGN